jgi:rhomboid-like protein
MNNVWTAVAFRAPCVAKQIPRRPLLQLFNGYSRLRSTTRPRLHTLSQHLRHDNFWKQCFSSSAYLQKAARPKKKVQKPKSEVKRKDTTRSTTGPRNASKLEPATIVATHTEGQLQEEQPLTWRDYDPVGGMPLPGGELSQPQINGIFGNDDLDADTGNYVLSVLHWRRLSGALIDTGIEFPADSGVTSDQAFRGLEYVRSLDPAFNEQAAGQIWAEEESARLQDQLAERAVNLRLYKRDEEPEPPSETVEVSDQGTAYGRERSQDSALIRLREANIARNEAEEAKRMEKQERKETAQLALHRGPLQLSGGVQPPTETQLTPSGGITISRPQSKAWLQPVERKAWVKYYEEHAMIIKENTVPQMSMLRRLGPAFIMLLVVLSLCTYLSDNYTPPPKSARIWPDTPPSVATLAGLTAVLCMSFIAGRMPPLWRTYGKYFTIIPAWPYAASLVGSIFRHDTLSHLAINTSALWLFGSLLHEDVGRGTFIAIFIASGAIGGYSSLVYQVMRQNWGVYIFGSSAAGLGVLAATSALRPNSTIKIWGYEVPIAAWVFLVLYGAGEVIAVVQRRNSGLDHVGHVGGMLGGAACALCLKMRLARQEAVLETEMNTVLASDVVEAESATEKTALPTT